MAGEQISTSVTIINSLLGFQAISLTNINAPEAPAIAAGSKVEIAGGFFTFGSDATPQVSTWTPLSTGNTVFITLTPTGEAGSQIVTPKWSATGPVWSDSKQGWYASPSSSIRYVAKVVKTSGTAYAQKSVLGNKITDVGSISFFDTEDNDLVSGSTQTFIETISVHRVGFRIGEWNMDDDSSYIAEINVIRESICGIDVYIKRNDGVYYSLLANDCGYITIGDGANGQSRISLLRAAGTLFDSVAFDGTVSTIPHRGIGFITYADKSLL